MNEFNKTLQDIKGDLDRNLKSPLITGKLARMLLRFITVTITENQRLNERIDNLEQELTTKTTYIRKM